MKKNFFTFVVTGLWIAIQFLCVFSLMIFPIAKMAFPEDTTYYEWWYTPFIAAVGFSGTIYEMYKDYMKEEN